MSKSSPFFSDGGALRNKRNYSLTVVCLIIIVSLWNTSSVSGAPAKLDSLESPFPLDLQPPVLEAASPTTSSNQGDSVNGQTIDSYGNLIESLQPIDTPDGRKVVSAQGLQFEIPNYASGITELKKPADDLLPPFVGELKRNDLVKTTTARIIEGRLNDNDKQGSDDYADNWVINLTTTEQHLSSQVIIDESQPYKLRISRQPIQQNYQLNTDTNNNNNNHNFNSNTPQEHHQQQQKDEVLKPQTNLDTNTFVAYTTTTTNKPNKFDEQQQQQQKFTTPTTTPYSTLSSNITNSLSLFVSKQINKPKSHNLNSSLIMPPISVAPSSFLVPTPYSPSQFINSLKSLSSKAKLTAQYAPISNGNFNYPNIPTDLSIIERIASKYKNPLPTIDPIVVALPDDTVSSSFITNSGLSSSSSSSTSAETTTVDVESVPIVEVKTDAITAQSSKNSQFLSANGKFKGLPSYILELNDPDIAGPVDYVPDNKGLKVIAWDLLPPFETDAEKDDVQIITQENSTPRTVKGVADPISHNIKVTLSTGQSQKTTTQGQVSVVDLQNQSQLSQTSQPHLGSRFASVETTTTKPNYFQQNRGSVYYSSTTLRPATTTRHTTTTTLRTTTTPRSTTTTTPRTTTTTTRRTTTPRTTPTTTRTTASTTTAEPDTSEFFKLEAGDSYTLPPWLQDVDDPELDVAVTYIVPEDIDQYNHTIDRDILPPFEPYTDLNNLHLTPPTTTNEKYSTTTARTTTLRTTPTPRSSTTITTTARPKTTTTTTKRPALSTSQPHWVRAKPTSKSPTTLNNQFLTNHNQDSDNNNAPFTQSFNFAQRTTTSTTTVKPKTTVNYYNRPSSNTPKTDKIGGSSEKTENAPKTQNPFLPTYNDGAYRPQATTRRTTTSTTTTTTTTTAAPDVDENPFEATIPPWLKDFDYADVGPGVPFVYDPNEDELPVDKDILPPTETSSETNNKPTFIKSPSSTSSSTSSSSFLLNSQNPQGFTNKLATSATSLTSSSSSIPSKVTKPLPSIPKQQQQEQKSQDQDSTLTQPPLLFVPPPSTVAKDDNVNAKKTSSSFTTNFAAPFDPTTNTVTTYSDDTKKTPLGADRESFPPFNNVVTAGDVTGSATLPSKTIFRKSEDGKVITNNVFLNGGAVGGGATTSAKPFATSNAVINQQKETFATQSYSGSTFTKATTAATNFNQFGTTSAGASGFVTASGAAATSSFGSKSFGASSNGGFKYTGTFGGPPGVLAPQSSGFTTAKPVTKSGTYNRPATTTVGFAASASSSLTPPPSSNNFKFTGSFGGPPGVFKPYDNVKN